MRVVFMGTPSIAADCLKKLIDERFDVVGVLCQPDRPSGRGHKVTACAVKELAVAHGIPVCQPERLKKDIEAQTFIANLKPDVLAVVAYGQLLPKSVLDIAPLGAVNMHASLLPKYRGAAPVQWAIINGETVTGVTTMLMDKGMDTGDMLIKRELDICPQETAATLFERVSALGAECLADTLHALGRGGLTPTPQDNSEATYAPMLTKEDGLVDFSSDADTLDRRIRGVTPSPSAYCYFDDKVLKIYRAELSELSGGVGILLSDKEFIVGTANGSLNLLEVALAGSKRVSGSDFIRGRRLKKGDNLF